VPGSSRLSTRLLVTILGVLLYRIGTAIPLPTVRPQALFFIGTTRYSATWQYFSGNPTSAISVFALGIVPYVTSGLVLFLLGNLVPSLARLQASGQGRERLRRITRIVAVTVATLQAVAVARGFAEPRAMIGRVVDPGLVNTVATVAVLVMGFMLLTLVADMITRHGIGSGVSVLLLATVVSGLGTRLLHFLPVVGLAQLVIAAGVVAFGVVLAVVGLRSYVLLVAHANRIQSAGVVTPSELRPPVLQGGIMTLIFATTFLGLITVAAATLDDDLGLLLQPGSGAHALAFVVLVAGFARLQLRVTLDPVRAANDLVSGGFFLDGTAPGWPSANRLAAVGNVAALAVFFLLGPLSLTLHMAGTVTGGVTSLLPVSSLLLVVTIGLDILRTAKAARAAQPVFAPLRPVNAPIDPLTQN